jgi:hypothetical protein
MSQSQSLIALSESIHLDLDMIKNVLEYSLTSEHFQDGLEKLCRCNPNKELLHHVWLNRDQVNDFSDD